MTKGINLQRNDKIQENGLKLLRTVDCGKVDGSEDYFRKACLCRNKPEPTSNDELFPLPERRLRTRGAFTEAYCLPEREKRACLHLLVLACLQLKITNNYDAKGTYPGVPSPDTR